MLKDILIVYDGSEPSLKALSYAYLFIDEKSELTILYIIDYERYDELRRGVGLLGGGRNEVNQIISRIEAKIKKQLSGFFKECDSRNAKTTCIFRIGKIAEVITDEIRRKQYQLLIFPYGKLFEEKIGYVIGKIMNEFEGNMLIVR